MEKKMKFILLSTVIAGGMMLTACQSPYLQSESGGNTTGSPATQTTPTTEPSMSTQPAASIQPVPATQTDSAPSSHPAPSSSEQSGQVNVSSNSALLNQIKARALQGGVVNEPFNAGVTMIDQLKQQWGQPAHEGVAGSGIYANYPSLGFDIGFNKGGQIFDIRSFQAQIKQITKDEVQTAFGQPQAITQNNGQEILIYSVNTNYQLQFVFPRQSGSSSTLYLDHYNVFWSKGAKVNSMAAQ